MHSKNLGLYRSLPILASTYEGVLMDFLTKIKMSIFHQHSSNCKPICISVHFKWLGKVWEPHHKCWYSAFELTDLLINLTMAFN